MLFLAVLPACGETIDGAVDDLNRGIELGRSEARGYKGSERLLATPLPANPDCKGFRQPFGLHRRPAHVL